MNRYLIIIILFSFNSFAITLSNTSFPKKNTFKKARSPKKVLSWGHNLSPTTNTLPEKTVSAGIYLLGYGFSDDIMIATSPWFHMFYNMDSYIIKSKLHNGKDYSIAFQTAYFKSKNKAQIENSDRNQFVGNYYQMEAILSNLIFTKKITPYYIFSTNFGHHYYLDETVPFSVRRESFKDSPYQFNLSTYHEFLLEENFSIGTEFGLLGMNYLYPQVITGISFNFKGASWQMQLGVSVTGTSKAYLSSKKVDNNRANNGYTSSERENGKVDFSAHPEIQLQYYF